MMKQTQTVEAMRAIQECGEAYNEIKMRAEQHVLSHRLLAMGDTASYDLHEELKMKYEKYLAAIETYNQIERMEEINAQ